MDVHLRGVGLGVVDGVVAGGGRMPSSGPASGSFDGPVGPDGPVVPPLDWPGRLGGFDGRDGFDEPDGRD